MCAIITIIIMMMRDDGFHSCPSGRNHRTLSLERRFSLLFELVDFGVLQAILRTSNTPKQMIQGWGHILFLQWRCGGLWFLLLWRLRHRFSFLLLLGAHPPGMGCLSADLGLFFVEGDRTFFPMGLISHWETLLLPLTARSGLWEELD